MWICCRRRRRPLAVVWQVEMWSDDTGCTWLDYESDWNRLLESAYQYTRSRPFMSHTVELQETESGYVYYEVDLRTFTQTSWSGTERRVRRVLVALD